MMLVKVENIFKAHWLAIALAILVGLVCLLPQVFLMYELGPDYQGVAMAGTDAEEYYNSRVEEAYDGHWSLSSPDMWEYKDKAYAQPPLPEITVALIAKILNITPRQAITLGKFIFPLILYLVLYFLVLSFTNKKIVALTIPVAMMLATNFIFHPGEIIKFITLEWQDLHIMVDYTRPVNPQFSSLVFWLWLLVFYKWLTNKSVITYTLSIILLGSLFYIYPYSWTLAFGLTGFLFLVSFFNKKTKLNLPTIKLLILMGFAFIIGLPYWINYYHSVKDPLYELLQKRYGFYYSHKPLWSNILFADLILMAIYRFKRQKDLIFYVLLGTFLSLFALINQQVVTGLRLYPGHWHWYYTAPFTILFLLYLIFDLLQQRNKLSKFILPLVVLTVLVSFTNATIKQWNTYQEVKSDFITAQKYAPIFDWLNQNTVKDDVVLSDGDLNTKLAIYTHNNNYFSRWGEFYIVPHERFEDRLLARAYLNKTNSDNVGQYISPTNKDTYEYLFGRYRLRSGQCNPNCFTEEELQNVRDKYLDFINSNPDFEQFLKKYRLDYITWDTDNNPNWSIDEYKFTDFITEINQVRVYKVI